MKTSKARIAELLERADIKINGSRPWDITVHNEQFYNRVLAGGSLALGESYVDGWWDTPSIDQFIYKIVVSGVRHEIKPLRLLPYVLRAKFFNLQNTARAFEVGEAHYDIGNDLYTRMLDTRLVYTCGYWSGTPRAHTLDAAQDAKLDLVCRKLNIQPGDRVLDIGCGWGSFAQFAAERYGAHVVGLTISKAQKAFADERVKGLPVEIRLQDYRDVEGTFDHIVSLGMFEHVGYKNYRTYMEVTHRVLADDGLFLLHTIGGNKTSVAGDPWIEKYIFPNGMLPSIAQVGRAIEHLFVMEDWHNFGADYDHTLMAWADNFERSWDNIKDNYSERFYRMWTYYLRSMAGAFRSRENTQLWQIVLSKNGVPGGYRSVR